MGILSVGALPPERGSVSRSGIEYFFAFYSATCVRRRPKCCGSQSRAPVVVEMRPLSIFPEFPLA